MSLIKEITTQIPMDRLSVEEKAQFIFSIIQEQCQLHSLHISHFEEALEDERFQQTKIEISYWLNLFDPKESP